MLPLRMGSGMSENASMENCRLALKRVAFTVACVDAVAIALFAVGMSLVFGTIGVLVVVLPALFVLALLGFAYLRLRREHGSPVPLGNSFGQAGMYWRSAWMLAAGGIAVSVGMVVVDEPGAALLTGVGAAGFVVTSVLLARHSD
jgi:hypothetical protein